MAIRELEQMTPSRIQKAAEQSNFNEIFDMWNNAMDDPDFKTDQVEDVRIVRDRLNQINDGNVFAVIKGDSRYGEHLTEVTQDMLLAVEVTPEVAKQLRDTQRNMGERFNLWDELQRRHIVGPNARNDAAIVKISQADYEAVRGQMKAGKDIDGDGSKAVAEMSQGEYEKWRKRGGGR